MNPLFERLDESTPVKPFFEALGFEVDFKVCDYGDTPDPVENQKAYDDFVAFWNPPPPDGFERGCVYENEYGIVACFLKPVTPFAWAIWRLSRKFKGGNGVTNQHDKDRIS